MTPLIDAARTLLEMMDEHTQPPWHTFSDRQAWRVAVLALLAAVEDAEADLARAADVAAGRA